MTTFDYEVQVYGPVFEVDLSAHEPRVRMNGKDLASVVNVSIKQSVDSYPEVTITFRAKSVVGIRDTDG